jgi:hypothetical protein
MGPKSNLNVKLSDVVLPFDGRNAEFSKWVEKLELVSSLQGIKELEKFLPLFLTDGAFAVYQMLPDDVKGDYKLLRMNLLQAFATDPVNAYDQFIARKLCPGESVDVFLADLKRLAGLVDSCGASDQWLKCAFIAGLPDHVRAQLRAACSISSMSLEDVLGRARALLWSSSETCMVSAVARSAGRGQVVTCYACGEVGHLKRLCPRRGSATFQPIVTQGRERSVRRCFVCGDLSHMANACPNRFDAQAAKNE